MPLPVSGGGPQGLGYEMAWEEISGPADPLLVRVAVQGGSDSNSNHPRGWVPESDPEVDEPGRGSGFTDGLGGLTLTLEVSSRLDWGLPSPPGPGPGSAGGSGNGGVLHGIIAGVEVQVKVKGPALVDKRGVSWTLPRMTPGDKVRRTIGVRVNGYDPVEVHVMLLPCPHPPSALAPASFPTPLACKPWRISSVSPQALLLSPPSTMKANGGKDKGAGPLTAAEFFRLWACLPARTDLSGEDTEATQSSLSVFLTVVAALPSVCLSRLLLLAWI